MKKLLRGLAIIVLGCVSSCNHDNAYEISDTDNAPVLPGENISVSFGSSVSSEDVIEYSFEVISGPPIDLLAEGTPPKGTSYAFADSTEPLKWPDGGITHIGRERKGEFFLEEGSSKASGAFRRGDVQKIVFTHFSKKADVGKSSQIRFKVIGRKAPLSKSE